MSVYNNPEESLSLIQNLMLNDKNPDNQIIYRNLIAQAYAFKGDYVNAVKSSLAKDDSRNNENSRFHDFYLNYSFADQYQNLGLFGQSRKSIIRALETKNFPKNSSTQITVGKFFQLQAINNIVSKNYQEALQFLNKSDSVLTQNFEEVKILKIENQLFRGNIYINQNKLESAKLAFSGVGKSKIIAQSKFLYAYSKVGISKIFFLEQNYEESIKALQDGLQKIENMDFIELRSKIYAEIANTYLAQNNQSKYHYFQNLNKEIESELNRNKKSAINYLLSINEIIYKEEIATLERHQRENTLYIALFSGIILLCSAGFYFITYRKEKDLKKQEFFFEHLTARKVREETIHEKIPLKETPYTAISEVKKPSLLSPEKENELLEKLNLFENSKLYLSKQISLPLLAAELSTNIKYLSEIIREKKGKKFNAYINNLRIEYIVNQLQTNSVYLNYKVSHLAEITGFSSHSAFTSVFRSITGISPNEFIQQLSQAKKQ